MQSVSQTQAVAQIQILIVAPCQKVFYWELKMQPQIIHIRVQTHQTHLKRVRENQI